MITLFNNKQDCCGCTACKSICSEQAISMLPDEEGFQYPEINRNLCVECGLCKKVCVFQNGYTTSDNYNQPEVYALKHRFDEVRKNSSSGGAFTAISDYILSKKGLICGAAYDENFYVAHQRAETAEERNKFRGS
ncbi:MAG: 4Fe-4S dicluster domain-containing protein [Acidaminococcaceae bacterium]|nr:4Fe-4S dicluster domain-containing protein [Acidaminococcaceae bacterium]